MAKLSNIVSRLAAGRGGLNAAGASTDRLDDFESFGSNPGNLRARSYIPDELAPNAALVVVLHGCTQTAAGYDIGAGWSRLADEYGFALLFPEQRSANNPNLCFNWFSPADTGRGKGEALSIRQMIEAVVAAEGLDRTRVFVTGLSAGGAMASVMLATYPELFAGGAIVAGLPFGSAAGVTQALERMRGQGLPDAEELGALVHRASDHAGPWPLVSVWHGTADATVGHVNADAVVAQWAAVHRVDPAAARVEMVDGHRRKVWHDAAGRPVIEQYSIAGMGHGTPLATKGEQGCGTAGPFMLEAGISSSRHIAAAWGLIDAPAARASERIRTAAVDGATTAPLEEAAANMPALRVLTAERVREAAPENSPPASGVGKIIEDALRAAGLMR